MDQSKAQEREEFSTVCGDRLYSSLRNAWRITVYRSYTGSNEFTTDREDVENSANTAKCALRRLIYNTVRSLEEKEWSRAQSIQFSRVPIEQVTITFLKVDYTTYKFYKLSGRRLAIFSSLYPCWFLK